MADISHKTLGYAESHVIHFAEYANTGAREGAGGLTSADDDKIALQTDNDTYWRLTDYSGPTWLQVMGSFYSQSDVETMATKAAPIGTVSMTFLTSAPTGWLLLNGETMGSAGSGADNAHADYEDLFAIIKEVAPNAGSEVWGDDDPVTLPDMAGSFPLGATSSLGATGGAATKDLSHTHTGAAHTHDIDSHTHGLADEGLSARAGTESSNYSISAVYPANLHIHTITTDGSGALTAKSDGDDATTSGGSATQDILPPYVKINFMVKFAEY